ncbi:MAG: TrkH family potassium uptake protein [Flavobacteriaceae bacterium]
MQLKLRIYYRFVFIISLLGLISIIIDFGFSQSKASQLLLDEFYFIVLIMGLLSTGLRYLYDFKLLNKRARVFDVASVFFTFWVFYLYLFVGIPFETDLLLENPIWIQLAVILTFLREFSELKITFKRTVLNPAQLFIVSFLFIIFIGMLLLKLPHATHNGISYMDALFTSTSAVCVTGLAVVDTATTFTKFGQLIIVILIQIGGLGILTFASYFSYFFKGGATYENQLALGDITSSKKLGEVFSTLKNIILITFSIELVAAILIYFTTDTTLFKSNAEHIFFSVFHSVSAFCNAGFSTLSSSLYDLGFRFNYPLQIVIIFTFVLGGLGFPIVVNILTYFKYKIKFFFSSKRRDYKPWILNLNSRITLVTTLTISLISCIAFFIFEYDNTLAPHDGIGKVVTAIFGATTPRTAGFNTIDSSTMTYPTLMMVIFLMWVGASPQSTGGGIKTSTFAIATLNILSLAKGKNRIELFRREISDISVKRSYAIISLSLMVISMAVIFIAYFEKDKQLSDIIFECVSAYSTVGLSLGITPNLSEVSKVILVIVMFVGRISMLSFVIAVFKKIKYNNYTYPKEEITIN